MSAQFKRTDRIAEMIQRKLAQIIPMEIKDPRLKGFITLSAVKVTADLGHAKIYFTTLDEDKNLAVTILNAAAGYLRTALTRSISLRTVPQLHFVYDESLEYAQRLNSLIDKANSSSSEESFNNQDETKS